MYLAIPMQSSLVWPFDCVWQHFPTETILFHIHRCCCVQVILSLDRNSYLRLTLFQRDIPSNRPSRTLRGTNRQSWLRCWWVYAARVLSAWLYFSYAACPSSFHEFQGPEAIPYDVEGLYIHEIFTVDWRVDDSITGTDRGNRFKVMLSMVYQ